MLSPLMMPQFLRYTPPHPCFFFYHPATTSFYTLSLHDALPISSRARFPFLIGLATASPQATAASKLASMRERSEEHTSELQSRQYLVSRLVLEKNKRRP